MMKVRLKENYPNQFWNSANGVTILKTDRVGVNVDEANPIIDYALRTGILEIVDDEKLNIIQDHIPKETIKEVVSPKNSEELRETVKKIKDKQTMKPEIVNEE